VFLARFTIGRRKVEPAYVAVLIVASLVFYGWHIPAYVTILLASTLLDYAVALRLGALPLVERGRRRAWLAVSVVTNLGLLAFFKYASFFERAVEQAAAPLGLTLRLPDLAVVLPIGISFYTFQTLSYSIDVYRGRLAPVRRFWPFLLFVSFFPQLVAGPIVRASEFLPQIPRPRRLTAAVFYHGVWLIIGGFFLKMVCADGAAAYVDEYWERAARPTTDATFALWLTLMFSGQIFADFCGYSTIACGLASLLGYRLPLNFNAPYIAGTFKNFWERWHITLSQWLRDYLYVPLGGNRGPRWRTLVNLLLVMLLGGLWHGAAYTYVIWGGIHGLCLAAERALGLQRRDRLAQAPALRVLWFGVVQVAVLAAWVYFRSPTVGSANAVLANILAGDWRLPDLWMLASMLFLAPVVALHGWTWARERELVAPLGVVPKSVLAALMAYGVVTLYAGTSEFIYFQF
jgi:alginate O-acetyltransferase complex protein AlgI